MQSLPPLNENNNVERNGSKVGFRFDRGQSEDDGKSRSDSSGSSLSAVSQFAKTYNNNNERRSSLRRNISKGNLMYSDHTESKVMVIYTGGTIGMMRNENDGECVRQLQLLCLS